ncbi:hypothetical protein [Streptomyces sp. CB00455]|uniref:hypothetical protein n=1 Tax=Streptomyces sp. CB00455 TaxID=1703927 RepID=UPI00094000C8
MAEALRPGGRLVTTITGTGTGTGTGLILVADKIPDGGGRRGRPAGGRGSGYYRLRRYSTPSRLSLRRTLSPIASSCPAFIAACFQVSPVSA